MTDPRVTGGDGTGPAPHTPGPAAPLVGDITRRQALGYMAAIPALAAFDPPALERAARAAAAALRTGTGPAYEPQHFSAHEWETVRLLVDLIIPRDERSGSATDAGVPEFMDFMLGDRPALQVPLYGGLRWLDAESLRRSGRTFVAASDAERRALLDDIAWPARARPELSHGVGFFNDFRDLTAAGFFSSKLGVEDLRYLGNTYVEEWDGCPEPALRKLGVSYEGRDTHE